LSVAAGATQDLGQIAVIGTMHHHLTQILLICLLSLCGSVREPANSCSRNQNPGSSGTAVNLGDDDSREITFTGGFRFPFFGTTYLSVFINSDGNLTFGQADSASTDRNLTRFNSGPPRIGGFFADLDPTTGRGGVFYNALPDRFVVTWDRIREFGGFTESSFQVSLFADGAFELVYGGVSAQSGIAGWSGGRNSQALGLVDLSASSGILFSGPKAERFARTTELDLPALAEKFYQTCGDEELVMFTNFVRSRRSIRCACSTSKRIRGIGLGQFDFASELGSSGRLQSFLAMNQWQSSGRS
jgi:hypothetical protein